MIDREALKRVAHAIYYHALGPNLYEDAEFLAAAAITAYLTHAGEGAVPVVGERERIEAAGHKMAARTGHAFVVDEELATASGLSHPPRQDDAREVTGYLDRDGKPVDLPADKISPGMVAYFGLTPATTPPAPDEAVEAADDVPGWSCEEKFGKCRNPYGCHCREIEALQREKANLIRARSRRDVGGV